MREAPNSFRRPLLPSILSAILPFLLVALLAAAAAAITVDGAFSLDEWEGAGPLVLSREAPWLPDNDLQALFVAWDATNLYVATVGYAGSNNVFFLLLDSSARTTGIDAADRYPGLRAVEAGWDPDFIYTCVEMEAGIGASVRAVGAAGATTPVAGALHAAKSPAASGTGFGAWEIAIPWTAIGTTPGGTVRVAAGLGWATNKHDPAAPLGGMSGDELPPGRDGDFWVLDEPLRIEYDRNGDGLPDPFGVPFAEVPIRFRYHAPFASSVHLACETNGWSMSADPMTGPDGEGWWSLAYPLPLGFREYKFVVNGSEWEADPLNPIRVGEFGNSALFVSAPSAYYVLPLAGSTVEADSIAFAVDLTAAEGDTLAWETIAIHLDGEEAGGGAAVWDPAAERARITLRGLEEGEHVVEAAVRTVAGAFFVAGSAFTVRTDTIPPVIGAASLGFGDGGRSVRLEAEITDDKGVEWARLYVRAASGGAVDSTEGALGRFDVWHAEDFDPPGSAGDTLVAWFAAGDGINRTESEETRLVLPEDGTDPRVEDDFIAPAAIAPGDSAKLSFRLTERASVDAAIEIEGGGVVAFLARDTTLAPGYHAFLWDGRDSTGAAPSPGTYGYRIDAADPSGNEGGASESFVVVGAASEPTLKLILLFHANQTVNYRGDVANDVCFRGILEAFEKHPSAKAMFHFSGTLLHDIAWFEGDGSGTTIGLLRDGIRRGQYEIVGSTYAQNVPYGTHDWDNGVQVEAQKAVIESLFAVAPVSWWNAERCWRQGLVPLMEEHGYRNTWVETHILHDSGMEGDPWEVRTTALGDDRIVVFNDDGNAIGPVDYWIDSGDSTSLMGYLRYVQGGNRHGTRAVCYCQDAEATGLWDFESGGDPAADWENLDDMLGVLTSIDWIELTTFSDYLEQFGPTEELTPIADGQANWMVGPSRAQGYDDWFDYNANSPMLADFRAFFDTMRAEVQTMEVRAGSDPAAANLVRHGRRNFAAHQFEFACIGCGAPGCQDWRKMETIGSAAEAVRAIDEGIAGVYERDVNRDGAAEILLAGGSDLFVFTPTGGRLLYWWDLEKGSQIVGNEIFMYGNYYDGWRSTWTGDGWNDDRHYRPDFVWDSWNTVPSAAPFHREYGVRRRALNDRVRFGGDPVRELMNEEYDRAFDGGDRIVFTYGEDPDWTLRKEMAIDSASTLAVIYVLRNESGAEAPVRLSLENGLSPDLIEIMDHGRSSLRYWDGAAETDTATLSTVGLRNAATGRTVSFLWETPPDSLSGGENVFGLELNPVWTRTLAAGDSLRVAFQIAAAVPAETTEVEPGFSFRIGPNPFRPSASIRFRLAEAAAVALRVYTPGGRLVRELENRVLPAGEKEYAWDGRDGSGREAASGVYLIRLDLPDRTATRKAVLLR